LPPEPARRSGAAIALAALVLLVAVVAGAADRQAERDAMVDSQIAGRDVRDARVLDAMRSVPRHRFVPESMAARAYEDSPLPIGEDQTISQPYIVAKMTELLRLEPTDRVFELGTGSGYQAAWLCAHVWSVEIHQKLADRARAVLHELGYDNVSVRVGDGFRGWPGEAPFDAMLVTAAVPQLPEELLRQLRPGGRAVMPVGEAGSVQDLVLVEKHADGRTVTRSVFPVVFVPATGKP
jgi:protein-L-isoaspartate(D-aspartate) O-methyltransferase